MDTVSHPLYLHILSIADTEQTVDFYSLSKSEIDPKRFQSSYCTVRSVSDCSSLNLQR